MIDAFIQQSGVNSGRRAVLKAFFTWCVARNLAASNPVRRVKFFNEDNSRLRYLTEDEYNRLLAAAKKVETSPFLAEKIILAVHTGLRRGSLFHLRWDQVDFLNRVVRIHQRFIIRKLNHGSRFFCGSFLRRNTCFYYLCFG